MAASVVARHDVAMETPDNLNAFSMTLEARDRSRNIARRWQVRADPDLFGWLIVERSWGRIGTASRSIVEAFSDETTARQAIARMLARRATAKARIGVPYQLASGD